MMKRTFALTTLLASTALPLALAHNGHPGPGGLPTPNLHCWPMQNPHDYYVPGGARADLMRINGGDITAPRIGGPTAEGALHSAHYAGHYVVYDFNLEDCETHYPLGILVGEVDFDGEYEFGIGGGFLPAGFWADEPTCQNGYVDHHHTDVHVHDEIWPANTPLHNSVSFAVGADPTPPMVVPSTDPWDADGWACLSDGAVTPGPTDPDDWHKHCLHKCDLSAPAHNINPFWGQPGGDGGYHVWVDCHAYTDGEIDLNGPSITPPTSADGTCSLAGHIYSPNTWEGKVV